MDASTSLVLLQSVLNTQKELVVIFKADKPVLTNKAFNTFFAVSSCEQYLQNFGAFVNNFVPHPSYFHKEKMPKGESWFDGILKLPEIDRVVSMMTPSYEPHAFSVVLDNSTQQYTIATFTDITQSLIKRIMIENNTNIDLKSGAYTKEYFLHISRSYQDAALFNEKMIGAILIRIGEHLQETPRANIVKLFKEKIRQDDMLIRWSDTTLLLVFLVDDEKKADAIIEKLHHIEVDDYQLELFTQQKNEGMKALIKRIEH